MCYWSNSTEWKQADNCLLCTKPTRLRSSESVLWCVSVWNVGYGNVAWWLPLNEQRIIHKFNVFHLSEIWFQEGNQNSSLPMKPLHFLFGSIPKRRRKCTLIQYFRFTYWETRNKWIVNENRQGSTEFRVYLMPASRPVPMVAKQSQNNIKPNFSGFLEKRHFLLKTS